MGVSSISYIISIFINMIFIEIVINVIKYCKMNVNNKKKLLPVMIVSIMGIVDLFYKSTMIRASIVLIMIVAIMSTMLVFYEYISNRLFYYIFLIYGIYSLYITLLMSDGSTYIVIRIDLAITWILFFILYFCFDLYKKIYNKKKNGNEFIHIVCAVLDVIVFTVIFVIQSKCINELNYDRSLYITEFYSVTDYLVITLSILFFIVYYALTVRKDSYDEFRQKIAEFDYIRNQSEVENIKKMYNNARKIRHNYKSAVMGLKQMLASCEYEKIYKYLDEMIDNINFDEEYIRYCDNSIVNYILNQKAKLCKNKDIDFKCMVGGNFKNISDVDLSILFGNLLDNAIEAAQQAENAFVSVNIYCLSDIKIVIENSVKAKESGKEYSFKTNKVDADNHGLGVKSIYEIVEKNNGSIDYQIVNQIMVCNIII